MSRIAILTAISSFWKLEYQDEYNWDDLETKPTKTTKIKIDGCDYIFRVWKEHFVYGSGTTIYYIYFRLVEIDGSKVFEFEQNPSICYEKEHIIISSRCKDIKFNIYFNRSGKLLKFQWNNGVVDSKEIKKIYVIRDYKVGYIDNIESLELAFLYLAEKLPLELVDMIKDYFMTKLFII
jgi:hypothetical protein